MKAEDGRHISRKFAAMAFGSWKLSQSLQI